MYVRFPLSLRNVEDLLFERGIDVCPETVRLWWNRFGPVFAADIRQQRVSRMRGFRPWRWHLDEMYAKLDGEMVYLWRAIDHEGEVLESYVTRKRDKSAALAFIKKALKRHGKSEKIVTDGLRSYPAAMRDLGNLDRRERGPWMNNRVENSHLPFRRRERAKIRSRQMKSLQKFASVHASLHNHLASPPFGSTRNATSSIARPTSFTARSRWPSGSHSPASRECPQAALCQTETS